MYLIYFKTAEQLKSCVCGRVSMDVPCFGEHLKMHVPEEFRSLFLLLRPRDQNFVIRANAREV